MFRVAINYVCVLFCFVTFFRSVFDRFSSGNLGSRTSHSKTPSRGEQFKIYNNLIYIFLINISMKFR